MCYGVYVTCKLFSSAAIRTYSTTLTPFALVTLCWASCHSSTQNIHTRTLIHSQVYFDVALRIKSFIPANCYLRFALRVSTVFLTLCCTVLYASVGGAMNAKRYNVSHKKKVHSCFGWLCVRSVCPISIPW